MQIGMAGKVPPLGARCEWIPMNVLCSEDFREIQIAMAECWIASRYKVAEII